MNDDERVIDGVLGYVSKEGFVPYTAIQLTDFLLRAESNLAYIQRQASYVESNLMEIADETD